MSLLLIGQGFYMLKSMGNYTEVWSIMDFILVAGFITCFVQLFAQVVYDGHWWFYAINFESNYFIVLDSLPHKCRQKKQIDNNVMYNLENLLWLLMGDKNQDKASFELVVVDLPEQPNL
ncbi:Ulp1 protease family [Vigna unguiculata]|uniref:Ulp1 protease family n=1 Tax=Vigna unguiculata TaxID=3917 RepID=A0A4D6LQI5_VIGUN|nr:Ulp1 protease family [Vigna unguiculata]